jgi:hypothetical protein
MVKVLGEIFSIRQTKFRPQDIRFANNKLKKKKKKLEYIFDLLGHLLEFTVQYTPEDGLMSQKYIRVFLSKLNI